MTGLSLALRIGLIIAVIAVAVMLSEQITERVEAWLMPVDPSMIEKIIILSLLAYVLLMSLPFLPGAEIGLALLTAFGGAIAPAVYVATILALTLAFAVGRFVPCEVTARWLAAFGLKRGAALVRQLGGEAPGDAADFIARRTESPFLRGLLRYRYVALALLINMPGNVILGGGGGLALAAGLSRAFHPALFALTVAIAVMPVPLTFLLASR